MAKTPEPFLSVKDRIHILKISIDLWITMLETKYSLASDLILVLLMLNSKRIVHLHLYLYI